MATSAQYGFGEYAYPRGWFMVGTAADATPTPAPVRFFGEDLVLYRGASGKAHLVEAYCPHMGAHLARNTTSYIVRDGQQVEGDSIRCPFHGWRFGPDGQCDHIPYSDFIPKKACLKTYPLTEFAGILWTWHDPEGLEPDHPLPDFGGHYGEPGWLAWDMALLGDLPIHGCEVVDNMADYGHMAPVHGSTQAVYFANTFENHVMHQYFGTKHRREIGGGQQQMLLLDTWRTGPGILESDLLGEHHAYWLIAHTPVDEGLQRIWTGLMVKVGNGITPPTDETLAAAREFAEISIGGLIQDVEIWQNKQACVNPLAIPADGPYPRLRLWYSQFYNPREKAAAIQQRANGRTLTLDKREALGIDMEIHLAGADG